MTKKELIESIKDELKSADYYGQDYRDIAVDTLYEIIEELEKGLDDKRLTFRDKDGKPHLSFYGLQVFHSEEETAKLFCEFEEKVELIDSTTYSDGNYHCRYCNDSVMVGDNYCRNCGHPLFWNSKYGQR